MKKVFLIVLLLLVSIPIFAFTQDNVGGFDASQFITLLNPAIIFFAIQLAKKITAINSKVILAILVPGISLLGSWLVSLIVPDTSFLLTFIVGFASTFVYELYKQVTTVT